MNQDLMKLIAGQIASRQMSGDAKYPKVNRAAKGNNAAYYTGLGANMGDNWQAAQNLQKAQKMYREGQPMNMHLVRAVEMYGQRGDTKTTPQLPSRIPADVKKREQARIKNSGKMDTGPVSGSMPNANQSIQKSSGEAPKVGPKGDAEAQVAAEIEKSGYTFKGTKAPMQEDIDMVLNAEGSDRAGAYNAFVKAFGQDAAATFLEGED